MTRPDRIRAFAEQTEADGWDGLMFPDNQNLWGDTYVSMTVAATVTSRLLLCNASTNPGTRHPAVTASAVAAVDQVSGGRASLGIARGDSALAHLGAAPVAVAVLNEYLGVVRRLLHGKPVPFADLERWRPSREIDSLPLHSGPDDSRFSWLGEEARPVPITVFASGPRTIEVAAQHADRVIFGLGADPKRLAWGVRTMREACERIGRDPAEVALGGLMSIAVSDDLEFARSLVANIVASSVRFSSMHGTVKGPSTDAERRVFEKVATSYDMRAHGETANQVQALTPEFIDRFALVGPAETCVDRLAEIRDLGLDDVLLIAPRNDTETAGAASARALVEGVLPAARGRREKIASTEV
ncbi:LLM class flavin-dependent oxidoreductase [Amycolatopsis sp. K13G38]|uniref:LLM class flavin-dependent oxidoreductase n=1 Tax=Amycolatopsis acididurans TaxID=2724524 RepID=A0ABX1J8Z9_9PSEU|nr:LLM class flavin-dependent oxidoreductase [Amycolatopsis acididurans]NKQ56183.1 LLM class flavin-dependent oxidoreductase [Amycolatopsis acididurans]